MQKRFVSLQLEYVNFDLPDVLLHREITLPYLLADRGSRIVFLDNRGVYSYLSLFSIFCRFAEHKRIAVVVKRKLSIGSIRAY